MSCAAVDFFRVDRHPAQPHCYGRGGGEGELDERARTDGASVFRSDCQPVGHRVLRGEVEPHTRIVSLEGLGIEFHNAQEGERFVPGPDGGFEAGAHLALGGMLETDRETELDPVLRCPGRAGIELSAQPSVVRAKAETPKLLDSKWCARKMSALG